MNYDISSRKRQAFREEIGQVVLTSLARWPSTQSECEVIESPSVVVSVDSNSNDDGSSTEDKPTCNAPSNVRFKSGLSVSSPDLSFINDSHTLAEKKFSHDDGSSHVDKGSNLKMLSTSSPISCTSEGDVPEWFAPSPVPFKDNDSPDWYSPTPGKEKAVYVNDGISESLQASKTKTRSALLLNTSTNKVTNEIKEIREPNSNTSIVKNEEPTHSKKKFANHMTLHDVSSNDDRTYERIRRLPRSEHHHNYHHHHHHHYNHHHSHDHHHHHYHKNTIHSSSHAVRSVTAQSSTTNLFPPTRAQPQVMEQRSESNEVAESSRIKVGKSDDMFITPSFKQPVIKSTSTSKVAKLRTGVQLRDCLTGEKIDAVGEIESLKSNISPVAMRGTTSSRFNLKISKTNNMSNETCFRKSSDFKLTGRKLKKPFAPVKVRKKKAGKKKSRRFIDDEVAISQESDLDISPDEVETSQDGYESSFIDDSSYSNTDKMAPVYLKSIRHPANRGFYDMYRTVRAVKENKVTNQVSSGENSQYEMDSFCVSTAESGKTVPPIKQGRKKERLKHNHVFEVEVEDDDFPRTIEESVAGPSSRIKSNRPHRRRILSLTNNSSSQ